MLYLHFYAEEQRSIKINYTTTQLQDVDLPLWQKYWAVLVYLKVQGMFLIPQGCISCGILVSGIRARGVSSEHMENMEMFSCSPT